MSKSDSGKFRESDKHIENAKNSKKENKSFNVLESSAKLNSEKKSGDTHELRNSPSAKSDSLMDPEWIKRQWDSVHKSGHSQLRDQTIERDTGDRQAEVKAIHSSDKRKIQDRRFEGSTRNFEDYQRRILSNF